MDGISIPRFRLKNLVIMPERPSRRIQEYAPIKGADMEQRMIMTCKKFRPFSSYML